VQTRAFLTVGVLGGFTTYSAFGFETVTLLRDGDLVAGITNVSLQIVLGLTAVWLGLRVSQLV
jgi:CrcB protein